MSLSARGFCCVLWKTDKKVPHQAPFLLCNLSLALGFGSFNLAWSWWKSCLQETGLQRKGLISPGEAKAPCLVDRREGSGSSRWIQVNPFPIPPLRHCVWLFLVPPEHRRRARPESGTWDLPCSLLGFWPHVSDWVLVTLCPTLCEAMDCSPPGSSVHGVFQARILDWTSMAFSKGSNLGLLHCRQILYHLSHQGGPWQTCAFMYHMGKTIFSPADHTEDFDSPELEFQNPWQRPAGPGSSQSAWPSPLHLPPLTLVSISWPNSEAHVISSLVASGTGLLPPDWGLMTRRQAEFVRIITFVVWLKAVVLLLYYTSPCPTVSVLNRRAKGHFLWCTTTGSKYDI